MLILDRLLWLFSTIKSNLSACTVQAANLTISSIQGIVKSNWRERDHAWKQHGRKLEKCMYPPPFYFWRSDPFGLKSD
ncbi:hypothetical protein DFP73DRAFT_342265 [Morchella snyderi]|nr:hypothetical protein DFP73DRAFT_342265 [Morchella snyderi]